MFDDEKSSFLPSMPQRSPWIIKFGIPIFIGVMIKKRNDEFR